MGAVAETTGKLAMPAVFLNCKEPFDVFKKFKLFEKLGLDSINFKFIRISRYWKP